jgi:2-keto-4-pentenoate hydratase/2-oxohepta-3-ene-1,7-dioic acid hydratase in catechol pathway
MSNYKLGSFALKGEARVGIIVEDAVYDLADASGHAADASMMSLLADWKAAQQRIPSAIGAISLRSLQPRSVNEVQWLAPLPVPGTVFCAGANYSDHVAEMARVFKIEPDPDPHTLGLRSWHFIKNSRSVIGPDAEIELPAGAQKVDWEAELAVVIGSRARNMSVEHALDCVAGYTIANDLSARDLSRRAGIADHSPFKFDWLAHKSFETACPLGPWIIPAAQIRDPQNLDISLLINGELKQNSNTSKMIFTIAEQIADLSSRITLWPGDVILTGTPAGVGSATGQFLKSGDRISIRIPAIGELNNTVR